MSTLAAIPKDSGLMIAAKDKKHLDSAMSMATQELARQAAVVSLKTGLSVGYCAKIVLHRLNRRMASGIAAEPPK